MSTLICKLPLQDCNSYCILKTEWSSGITFKIYYNQNAWTGQINEDDIERFSTYLSMSRDDYMKICKSALSCHGGDDSFAYAIDEQQFCWTKKVHNEMRIKFGFVKLQTAPLVEVMDEFLGYSLDLYAEQSRTVDNFKVVIEELTSTKQQLLKLLEEEIANKRKMESELYSQFLRVLNTKKDKIAELQEELSGGVVKDKEYEEETVSMDMYYEDTVNEEQDLSSENSKPTVSNAKENIDDFTFKSDKFNLPLRPKRKKIPVEDQPGRSNEL